MFIKCLFLTCQYNPIGFCQFVIFDSSVNELMSQMVNNPPAMWETWVRSHVREIPWRTAWQLTSVFLLENPHGQRSLVGYSPQDHKGSDRTEGTQYSVQKYNFLKVNLVSCTFSELTHQIWLLVDSLDFFRYTITCYAGR